MLISGILTKRGKMMFVDGTFWRFSRFAKRKRLDRDPGRACERDAAREDGDDCEQR
jgi:hypothetical protein